MWTVRHEREGVLGSEEPEQNKQRLNIHVVDWGFYCRSFAARHVPIYSSPKV